MVIYYIGTPTRFYANEENTSLYREDVFHGTEEVLEGIEDLQVRFGVLEASGNLQYHEGDEILDDQWNKVQSIRIKVRAKNFLNTVLDSALMNTAKFKGNKNGEWEYEFSL